MMSRTVAAGVLAAVTFTGVATGSYMAVRQNRSEADSASPVPAPTAVTASEPVQSETEAVVVPAVAEPPQPPATVDPEPVERPEPVRRTTRQAPARTAAPKTASPVIPAATEGASPALSTPVQPPAVPDDPAPASEAPVSYPEPRPVEPDFEELVVPASAVIGLEIERTVSSEQAEVEDRVSARVTRDVYADGQLAIPSGSRVVGSVTVVERGGKMKDRARLGVRFHTLVLADGRQVPLRTETVFREGDSPGAESSRKIGGAAIGGAVLGAILGGGKGAVAGAAAGAAGGTAAVMAGGRNAATLASGSVVTIRLTDPVSIEVAR